MISDQKFSSRKPRVSRRLKVLLVLLAIAGVSVLIAVEYALRHAEPILRARVIQTLSTRFNSQVQLSEFKVTLHPGLVVEGKGLSLRSNLYPTLPPQISIAEFSFHTGILAMFRSPMRIGSVALSGLVIKVPPKGKRAAMPKTKKGHAKIKIVIDRIVCSDALLVMMTEDPAKTPLQFQIHALTLRRVGSGKPMEFDAQLVNPKPIGDIASHGVFGPWNADRPHDTPVNGTYSFTNADLSTTKGISGILSSKGSFSGPLDTLSVDGETDTPDFSVDVSGHKLALHTDFHAIVDGTNGNTYLQPVHARFLHTSLVADGQVVRAQSGKGHDIHLNVLIQKGRIEDLLWMGAKTAPPVMTGSMQLKTRFDLPAGPASVSRRLGLQGMFAIDGATFTNLQIQKRVDELSLRSQGHAGEAKQLSRQQTSASAPPPKTPAGMSGKFSLASQTLTLPQLVCKVPGAQITLAGTYTLDGKQFDFTGHARMDASISSMVGGWKGAMLKPADRLFARHGAGTEVPIKITGTKSDPHFGLNFKH